MRKKFTAFICALGLTYNLFAQSVGINDDGSLPNSAAILDIKSTTKGLLIPRMTTAQRNLLPNVQGLLVFDTDANRFFFYNNTGWSEVSIGANTWTVAGNNIHNNNTNYVGIGLTGPLANLDVARGNGFFGTAAFRGTANISHFNYAGLEDTYIRGGKATSNVVINDVGNNVGIGLSDPAFKLDVSGRMRLRSQPGNMTAGIWYNNYDNTGITGFIGEAGSGAPNHLGIYGTTSGWSLVMNTISGNVGINTFVTTAGNGKLNVRNPIDGHAIKLIGNNQFLSFFDEGNNSKGYVWNDVNNIEIGTYASNTNGQVILKARSIEGLAVLSDGRVKIGPLACIIPVQSPLGLILPKLSVQGAIGFKRVGGDQIGEWSIINRSDELDFNYNGGLKASVDDADGDWITFSDGRLKEELKAYKPVLDGIKKLDVLTYHFISDKTGQRSFGLIAQNVQQYFPEVVGLPDQDNLLGIKYSKIGVLAIKAIQEQQVIIENQQKKIEELEKRLVRLEEKNPN